MSSQLILVPIEPLAERYTEQWYRLLPATLGQNFDQVRVIEGIPLTDTVKIGTFLDINSTSHYKWSQLMKISEMFNNGLVKQDAVFLFYDMEFWGLEAIRLMADMNKVRIHMAAFLHAASHTKGDAFAIAANYQKHTEVGWFKALDLVFVGSEYSKKAFIKRRLEGKVSENEYNKIKVVYNPIFKEEFIEPVSPKENIVLLTNRPDQEKNVTDTLKCFSLLKKSFPEWRFVFTSSRKGVKSNDYKIVNLIECLRLNNVLEVYTDLTKQEYYGWLAKAKIMVSHSPEESYGYCIAEALAHDCIPVLYPASSHLEWAQQSRAILMTDCKPYEPNTSGVRSIGSAMMAYDFLAKQGTDRPPADFMLHQSYSAPDTIRLYLEDLIER